MKTKIALVSPKTIHNSIPLHLGYIATYLAKNNSEVEIKIFDGGLDNMTLSNLLPQLTSFQPDIVGVTACTAQAPDAYCIGDKIKHSLPNVLTVIGGIHPTLLPKEASEHFDVVVLGEGEKAFSDLVRSWQNHESIPQIIHGEEVQNIDDLPMPDFSFFEIEHYKKDDYSHLGLPASSVMLITSRGCPYSCVFCHNSRRDTKVRFHSALVIINEILNLHEKYGINGVLFEDDEFLINQNRFNEFAELVKQNNMQDWFRWACNVRATTVTVPLLTKAKEAGCVLVMIGFESGNEKILNYLKNGSVKLSDNYRAVSVAKEAGMNLGGYFIIGTPGETLEQMKETEGFISKANLVFASVNALVPYPGTKLWEDCKLTNVDYKSLNNFRLNNFRQDDFTISTVDKREFIGYLHYLQRRYGLIASTIHLIGAKKFLRLSIHRFRRIWIRHPIMVLKELLKSIH